MLWRARYETLILHDIPAPDWDIEDAEGHSLQTNDPSVLLVGRGIADLGDVERWRRLVWPHWSGYRRAIFVAYGAERDRILKATPPSRRHEVGFADRPLPVRLEGSDRVAAMVVHAGRAVVAMFGPPTESALETFTKTLARLRE
ncbi:MAG: hypothetical protein KIS66_11225 [Fimbriimonadaceae bacterium]|nr:hypothetical protein [Fimbriimonadaceae bacterium]